MNWDTLLTIFNKLVIVWIGILIIWTLQVLVLHPEVVKRYPLLKGYAVRLGLAMMGAAVGADLVATYVPSLSEIVLNIGLLVVFGWAYFSYRSGRLTSERETKT